jgi:hypothetical protein
VKADGVNDLLANLKLAFRALDKLGIGAHGVVVSNLRHGDQDD